MAVDQSLVMNFPNSQGDVEIYMPENTTVLVKSSGGADSSILLYMLAKYKNECNPTTKFLIATSVNEHLPYQFIHSQKVVKYIDSVYPLGDYEHHHASNRGFEFYGVDQNLVTEPLSDRVDKQYMGLTLNPPVEEMKKHGMYDEERPDERDPDSPHVWTLYEDEISEKHYQRNRPFARHDKRGIAEFYDTLGVRDTLYPLTRSCEDVTTDFSHHCGRCWFCLERKWGFGELDPPVIV